MSQRTAQRDLDDELISEDDRNESVMERLDRNTVELLNELRVAAVGIQVLFAFLLIVPFNTGLKHVLTGTMSRKANRTWIPTAATRSSLRSCGWPRWGSRSCSLSCSSSRSTRASGPC